MGNSATVTLPPLPPGATMNAANSAPAASALPTLPPGAKLNSADGGNSPAAASPPTPGGAPPQTGREIQDEALAIQQSDEYQQGAGGIGRGMAKSAGQTLNSVPRLVGHPVFKDETLALHGTDEYIGAGVENIAEFVLGRGILQGLKVGARLKQVGAVADVLEQYPKLAKLAAAGIKALGLDSALGDAAVTAGQTLAHGGSGGEAVKSGAEMGLLSAATHGVLNGAAKVIGNRASTMEKIGGVDTVIPAEVRNAKPTAQQQSLQQAYRATAQESARPALEGINQAAAGEAEEALRIPQAERGTTRSAPGSMGNVLPEGVRGKPTLQDQIGSQAQTIPDSVLAEKIGPPPAPKLPRINVEQEISKIGDFAGARDAVNEQARPIYEKANQLTDGAFQEANQEVQRAKQAAWKAQGTDRAADLAADLTAKRNNLEQMISGLQGKMNPEEIAAARTAFRHGYVLDEVSETLDSAWNGLPGNSTRSNMYRGIDGNRLMSGLQRLVKNMGRPAVEETLGKARLDALEQLADLNRTQAQRAQFGAAVKAVANYLAPHLSTAALGGYAAHQMGVPWEVGAMAGFAGGQAVRKAMDAVLTNPKVAQNLIFAIQSGARSQYYAPMIGAMIQQAEQQQ